MPHKLKQIVIKEISFVDKGASGDDQHAPKIVFWKGRKTMPKKLSMRDRFKGLFTKEGTGLTPEQVIKEFIAKAGLTNEQAVRAIISKAETEGRTPEQMLEDLKSQLKPEQQDILMLLLAAAQAAPPSAPTEPAPAPVEEEKLEDEMPEEEKELEKVLKGNPLLKDHLEKIKASQKADRAEITELRKQHKDEVAKRRRAEFKKDLEELVWLPGDHDNMARLLDNAEQHLDEQDQESLASLFRVTDGLVRKASKSSKFTEKGSARPDDEDDGSAVRKLHTLAKKLAKEEKITEAQARVRIMSEDEELRAELNKSTNATLGR